MRILVLMVLILLPSMAAGETVSFRQAMELAMERHGLVRAAAYERAAAALDGSAVQSRYLPVIRLEEAFGASNAPTGVFMMKLDQGRFAADDFVISHLNNPDTTTDFRTSLVAEMPIYDRSLNALRRMTRHREEELDARLARRREDLALAVASAYVEAGKAGAHREAARSAVAQAREHLRVARVRSETGVGLKSEELRARTFLASMEERFIGAENRVAIAALGLAMATGAPPGSRLDAGEPLRLKEVQPDVAQFAAEAITKRPDLREAGATLAQGEEGVALAGSKRMPTVYAAARYEMNDRSTPFGSDNDSWRAGAVLQWELYDGMRLRHEEAAATARRDAAREQLEQQRRQAAFDVARHNLERESALRRRDVARHAVEDGMETVRLLEKRYANSLASMADLLDAQAALNEARATLIDLEGDCQIAIAGLHHAAGGLLEEVLK